MRNTIEADHDSLNDRFLGTCVGASAKDLDKYTQTEHDVDHRGMRRYFTRAEYKALSEQFRYEVDPRAGLTMKNDWHIRYGRGRYRGQSVICIYHSQIHHFYKIPQDKRYAN